MSENLALFAQDFMVNRLMRIFVARLFHETNSFAPGKLDLEDFRHLRGDELAGTKDDGSILGAFLTRAQAEGWEVTPSFDLAAQPGPVVSDAVVEAALSHLEDDLSQALRKGLDGIFFILHGAMVSESHPDVEGLLLARTAELARGFRVPVAAILDLHANVTPEMARHADILLAYRCNPHTDAVEAGLRTAGLLVHSVRCGEKFRTHLFRVPAMFPATGTGTSNEPMQGLLAIARSQESPDLPAISICPGFAHSDTPCTGMSFQIVAKDSSEAAEAARNVAARLGDYAMAHAAEGLPAEWNLETAILKASRDSKFPALIVEPADNIGGGAPGDATWVLVELLRQEVQGVGVVLADPGAVLALREVAVGEEKEVSVGGRFPEISGPPVRLKLAVLRHSDGRFELEDRNSHLVPMTGLNVNMGPSVLARSEGITLLLTTVPTPPMDLGQWRCVGINPEDFRLITIKAAVAHRQAYDKIAGSSYTVATPGTCTSNLQLLPYRKLSRPIFPLDPP